MKSTFQFTAFFLCLCLPVLPALAATNTAATTSLAAVTTAYNACAAGDTLAIPAGSNNWASVLNILKPIKIEGAGTNSTIINGPAFFVKPGTNALTSITGIHFYQANWTAGYIVSLLGSNKMFRVYSCKFSRGNHAIAVGFAGNGANGPAFGVIDHNTFYNCNVSIYTEQAQSGDTKDGDTSWSRGFIGAYAPGTTNTLCIEDNVFFTDSEITAEANNNNQHLYGWHGARATFRNNYQISTGPNSSCIDGHGNSGTSGTDRSTMLFEIYSNRFDINLAYQTFDQRGGVWIFNNNTITNGNSSYGALWNEHGQGDSTSDTITNSFWWNNYRVYSGATQEFAAISSTLPLNGTYPFTHAVNTNYWLHAPASTNNFYPYTPLVYPHPLVGKSSIGQRPDPPTGLRLTP